jgi:hypothetical protein
MMNFKKYYPDYGRARRLDRAPRNPGLTWPADLAGWRRSALRCARSGLRVRPDVFLLWKMNPRYRKRRTVSMNLAMEIGLDR